jgi:hypothetical protein
MSVRLMIGMGGVRSDRVQFNEISLWTGNETYTGYRTQAGAG